MRRNWLLAILFFLGIFAVSLVLQAPAGLMRWVLGTTAPPVLDWVAPHSTVLAGEIPALRIGRHGIRIAWRYESLSVARLGPVFRVDVTGVAFRGEGRFTLTPHHRRVLLTDAQLRFRSPSIGKAYRPQTFRPPGPLFAVESLSVMIDRVDVDLRSRNINELTGVVHWDGARLDLVPGIDFGAVKALLSAPASDRIRLDVVNAGGTMGLSGTIVISLNGDVELDLLLEPRPGTGSLPADVLALVATPEGAGWRLRQTVSIRDRL